MSFTNRSKQLTYVVLALGRHIHADIRGDGWTPEVLVFGFVHVSGVWFVRKLGRPTSCRLCEPYREQQPQEETKIPVQVDFTGLVDVCGC